MGEYDSFKNPELDSHLCHNNVLLEKLLSLSSAAEARLIEQGKTLEKMAESFTLLSVLSERDVRREKDVDELYARVRDVEQNCKSNDIKNIIDRMKEQETKVENLARKVAVLETKLIFITSIASLVGSVIGAVVVKTV